MLDVALVKARPLRGEGVNVRGWRQPMPVTADTFGAQFIRLEDDKVQLVQVFSRDIFSNLKILVFVLLCYLQHSCVLLL